MSDLGEPPRGSESSGDESSGALGSDIDPEEELNLELESLGLHDDLPRPVVAPGEKATLLDYQKVRSRILYR